MGQTQTSNNIARRYFAQTLLLAALSVLFAFGGTTIFAASASAQFARRQTSAPQATIIYGYNDINNHLVSFDAAAPGTILTDVPITGLSAGAFLGGMDFRPSNGKLYAVGSDDLIYTINTTTGVATAVSTTPFTPTADAANEYIAFDFNPVTDRIRLVNTAGVNLRINPDNGTVVSSDTTVAFAPGDPNAANAAEVTQLAYSNNVAGATTTTAYAIDFNTDSLATLGSPNGTPVSPNSGQLFTVGSLGIVTSFPSGGFDISGATGVAYAALRVSSLSKLYTINLTTGAATLVGTINSAGTTSTFRLDGLAIQPPAIVPAPARTLFDFDGDKKADASVFRQNADPNQNFWYILNSGGAAFSSVEWGQQGDKVAPADYDGDTKTDIAIWRDSGAQAAQAQFFILNSNGNTVRVVQLGSQGDVLAVNDWDGDGKADPAVYRAGAQGYFFYQPSTNANVKFNSIPWGTTGDISVRGDFDNDGKADAAVFRPSNGTWYVSNSSNGAFQSVQFGQAGDRPVTGDYDFDGKTDFAVFRPSSNTWFILQSSNAAFRSVQFGLAGDSLVQADYDGDGKTDVAVWRAGNYFILRSSDNAFQSIQWGAAGDIPVASAYNQ